VIQVNGVRAVIFSDTPSQGRSSAAAEYYGSDPIYLNYGSDPIYLNYGSDPIYQFPKHAGQLYPASS
ncbi:MAG: hypothetical protein KGL70_01790, partial [Betaproteobacteria bacterium]|nr:hypothetical protein [Betaproteobacteria bacterium]